MDTLLANPQVILIAIALIFGVLSLSYLLLTISAIRQLRLVKTGYRLILTLIFLPVTIISSGILLGLHGYHRLTFEQPIAIIEVAPVSKQKFSATLRLPDGQSQIFLLDGDQVQIDAHIIKWKSIANLLGLHTHYQLDRISGRFRDLEDARTRSLSVYELSTPHWLDLISVRQNYPSISHWLFDAEYGSATYIAADKPAHYQLLVSTSGLLFREIDAQYQPTSPGNIKPWQG
jgi:hypothetical protein